MNFQLHKNIKYSKIALLQPEVFTNIQLTFASSLREEHEDCQKKCESCCCFHFQQKVGDNCSSTPENIALYLASLFELIIFVKIV